MTPDPIELEIILNRLGEIQQLMKQRLFRTGYSTILREGFDGSAGLTTNDGRLIGCSGSVSHSVPYARMVLWILDHFGTDDIFPGDTFITNDPYKGGCAHTPDLGAAMPVFFDGKLVAFCCSMGHKPDFGGLAPSTASPASRSIFHEGLIIPPLKLYEHGKLNQGVQSLIENNTRTPRLLLGDIEGQVGCMRVGGTLMEALCSEFTPDIVLSAMELLIASSEARLRSALSALPDGVTEATNWLDNDGAGDQPVRIHLRLTKLGDTLSLDFSGSDPQGVGPVNTVDQAARAAAVGDVVGMLDHTIPLNEGVLRAIAIDMGQGRVVSPTWPTPVNSYVPGAQLVGSCVSQCLGELSPRLAVGDAGLGLGAVGFGFTTPKGSENSVYYDLLGTSLGGTARNDGASILFSISIFETVQPIEIVETEFPIRIREFSVTPDSAGAGEHRGGVGFCKEWEMLADCQFVSRMAGRRFLAKGANGGESPAPGQTVINPATSREQVIGGMADMRLKAGDIVRVEQSGGGGWGNPRLRDEQSVIADVEDGLISAGAAEAVYGRKLPS